MVNNYYCYNEITYNKGYELEQIDIYNAMDKKTISLAKSKETLESFFKCVKTHNNNSNIIIDEEKLLEICSGCLLVEGSVFGVEINYEQLFETYKDLEFEQFLNYLLNIREAISLCILNEIGKKRIELEYALTLSEDTMKNFEEFKTIMEELFNLKNSQNKIYNNIDGYLDEYITNNLLNLQKNIISGNPLKVAKEMLEKMKGIEK